MIIEECGIGGTMLGSFQRHRDAAYVEFSESNRIVTLVSVFTHEALAEIDLAYMLVRSDPYGICDYAGRANGWHDAVSLALGKPGYGYSWYQIKNRGRNYIPAPAREW